MVDIIIFGDFSTPANNIDCILLYNKTQPINKHHYLQTC